MFWNKIKSSEIIGTIWYLLEDFILPPNEIGQLEDLFSSKIIITDDSRKSLCNNNNNNNNNNMKLISIVDNNRSRTISIILGKFRLIPEKIFELIIDLNPELLTQELTKVLLLITPTAEEYLFIKNYNSHELLDTPSKVIFHFNQILRVETRLECHSVAFTWFEEAEYLYNRFQV